VAEPAAKVADSKPAAIAKKSVKKPLAKKLTPAKKLKETK